MNSYTFQVTNSTHSLSFQEYDGQRYHCQVKETKYAFVLRVHVFLRITSLVLPNCVDWFNTTTTDVYDHPHSELAKIINGADVLTEDGRRVGEERNGTLVESLGFETIDNIYCRKFLISQEIAFGEDAPKGASGKSKFEITVWENYGARQLHRIEMLGSAWVVHELVSIVNEDFNPLPVDAFNIEGLLGACDVEEFFPPTMIISSRITDAIIPDPESGVFLNTTLAIGDSSGLRRSSELQVQPAPSQRVAGRTQKRHKGVQKSACTEVSRVTRASQTAGGKQRQ